ncbi:AAA family ATPase [Streptomyces sp. TLI_146]|uniref:ATP-binding protein n=1 Tax=Streptomyces sp. TLI_146 TaxID=1938858 RepID=UPI000C70459E|nr:LuxR family transcriptional regulator [Streptomyces sp. TLI_146]PKV83020.1 regulatory LuxR family protein [Streptomyces sp. TLI_146]
MSHTGRCPATEHRHEASLLAGRAQELRALRETVRTSAAGHPSLIHLVGESGIGKTSLIQALTGTDFATPILVGSACGAPLERDFSFGVVRRLFGDLLAKIDEASREALLDLAGRPARLVVDDAGFDTRRTSTYATHHALYKLIVTLSERAPLLLVVDDAHAADAPSMRFLAYAAHRLHDRPVTVLISTTDGEQPYAEEPLLALTDQARELRLAPISGEAVAEVVHRSVGDASADVVAACTEVTRGNPFLLTELLRVLGPETPLDDLDADEVRLLGSPAVAARLRARFRARPDTEALAHAVAVLGDGAEFDIAADLADLAPAQAARALDTLVAMAVVPNSHPLGFTHTFVRNAVLDSIPVGARLTAHGRAAQLLRAAHAPSEQVAAHLLRSGSSAAPWACEELRRAARLAAGRGAPDVAATYLRHALKLPSSPVERSAVLCELGSAELSYAPHEGIGHLRAALAAAADARQAAQAALKLVPALCMLAAHEEASEIADTVLAELGDQDPDLAWRLEAAAMMPQFLRMSTVPTALRRVERMGRPALGDLALRRAQQGMLATMTAWRGEQREKVVRCAREAIRSADQNFFRPPSYYTLFALARTDASAAIDEVYAVADRIAEGSRWPRATAIMAMAHGLRALHAGDLHEAVRRFASALTSFKDYGIDVRGDHCAVTCAVWFTDVLVSLGRLDQARDLLARHMDAADDMPETLDHTFLLYARGRLRLAEGDARGAVDDLEECGRRAEVWQMRNPAVLPWRSRAVLAHLGLGQRERARELAEQELELALAWGTDGVVGVAQHALAMAVGGGEGHELLTAAVARLATSPRRLDHAAALLDLAALPPAHGTGDEARATLHQAIALASECGAEPLVRRGERLLAQIGGGRRKGRRGNAPHGLTPQEHQIALAAARGATNRQIAQNLCVTVRNVEFHLSSAYRKLGVKRQGLGVLLLAGTAAETPKAPEALGDPEPAGAG